jgi:hypothetical protein
LATYVGRFDVETADAFTLPAKLLHVMTLLDAFDVMLEGREPSSHTFSPAMLRGTGGAGGGGGGGVTPLMTTALVVGDANAPTCDVRTMAPNPGRATGTPPDLEGLALRPAGTYCAAALTKDVKSDPDGRRTGIIV